MISTYVCRLLQSALALLLISTSVHAAVEVATRQSGKIIGQGKEKPTIQLTHPKGGWTVDRMIRVAGTVSDRTIDPVTITINGNRYLVRVGDGGSFDRKFPAFPGKNSVVVMGLNKAGNAKAAATVYSKATQVPITVILTSDTDGIYTDLHIYEPQMGLKNPFLDTATKTTLVYWASTSSPTGGNFYLNEQEGSYDQPGYGPYMYTHMSPPVGIFRIDANYWPSGDKAHTLSTLNVILNAGKANELRKVIRAPLAKPGETVTLAWIRFEKDGRAFVYSPVADPKPKNDVIWPNWVQNFKPAASESESYE